MVGAGAAEGLGDPLADPLAKGLDSPDAWDASAEGVEAAGLLVLPVETHPTTMVMIAIKVSGGAATRNGVRRQKGADSGWLLPGGRPAGPAGSCPSGLSWLPGSCSSLICPPTVTYDD